MRRYVFVYLYLWSFEFRNVLSDDAEIRELWSIEWRGARSVLCIIL